MAAAEVRVKNRRKDTGCCSLPYLRSVMVMFNIIFWLTGLTFLGLGIWTLLTKQHFVYLLGADNHTYAATTFLFLATGGLVVLVGVLGCVGTMKEVRCCLLLFAFLLLLIFLMEAATGVLAYMYESAIREELSRNLNRTMMEQYGSNARISYAVDSMQEDFSCCGALGSDSYKDWEYSPWQQTTGAQNLVVPDSCCISPSKDCGHNTHPSNIYWAGCWNSLEWFLKTHLILIGGVGLGFCCLQIFGIIFACCMARRIKETRGYI